MWTKYFGKTDADIGLFYAHHYLVVEEAEDGLIGLMVDGVAQYVDEKFCDPNPRMPIGTVLKKYDISDGSFMTICSTEELVKCEVRSYDSLGRHIASCVVDDYDAAKDTIDFHEGLHA